MANAHFTAVSDRLADLIAAIAAQFAPTLALLHEAAMLIVA